MALDTRLADVARNAATDGVTPLFNTGYIRLYTGTRPATPATALSGNTLLATPRFGATAFGAAAAGVATANAITQDSSAAASGVPTFARILKSDGTTVVEDVEVAVSGGTGNISLPAASIVIGAAIAISSYTFSFPMQGA